MNTWIYISIIAAVINWFIVFESKRNGRNLILFDYFTKPAVIILLIFSLYETTKFQGHSVWFALGLLFSLIGDLVLMVSNTERGFILGAISFMFTLLFYIIGLNDKFPVFNLPAILIAASVSITSMQLCIRLVAGVTIKREKKIIYLIISYLMVLSLMLISALLVYTQGERWNDGHALLVGFGGVLFYLSDVIIIWNKFIHPIRNARLLDRISYHIAQIFIIMGASFHLIMYK